jgi:hypothetical protein
MEKYLRVRYVFKLPAPFHLQLEQRLGSWQQHVLPPSVVLVTFRLPPHIAFGDALLQLQRLVLLPFVCAWLLPLLPLPLQQWQLPPPREGVPLQRFFLFLSPSGSLLGFDP